MLFGAGSPLGSNGTSFCTNILRKLNHFASFCTNISRKLNHVEEIHFEASFPYGFSPFYAALRLLPTKYSLQDSVEIEPLSRSTRQKACFSIVFITHFQKNVVGRRLNLSCTNSPISQKQKEVKGMILSYSKHTLSMVVELSVAGGRSSRQLFCMHTNSYLHS